jgi:type II secretory pathway component GspD/PulD (secretin)
MPSRFPAVLAVLALVLAAAGVPAEPPKPAYRAEFAPAPDTETQVACQVRLLTVRDDLFERAGLDFKPAGALTDVQLRALLEAVQGDRLSNVLQCPKVTLFDGQEAVVRATQQEFFVTGLEATRVKGTVVMVPKNTPVETGTTLTLCARASADRKAAAVRVNYKDVWVEGPVELVPVTTQITPAFADGGRGKPIPFTQYLQAPQVETLTIEKTDLTIPTGGHVVIPGPTRTYEVRQEYGPPVLSKIPYLSRMYKNVGIGRTTVRTYLIVSPLVLEVPADPAPKR